MSAYEVTVDHLAYIRERRHRREVLAAYRRTLNRRGTHLVQVIHEDDGTCCGIEPWPVTSQRILRALHDDGAVSRVMVVSL
jgi:hypothetical protein